MTFRPHLLAALLWKGAPGLFLALLLPHLLLAQKVALRAEYYSLDDGLSDRVINDIIQDRQGFVWIATPNGLNRFDGYEFIPFNGPPENNQSIAGAGIEQLDLAEDGRLVVQYQNNKLFFDLLDPRTDALTRVRLYPENGISGYIRSVTVNHQGKIHLVSVQKQDKEGTYVYRYNPEADPAIELLFRIPEVHSSYSPVIDMVQLPDGAFLINDSELGLRLFSPNGALLKSFSVVDFDCLEGQLRYPGRANFLHLDRSGSVWLSLSQAPGLFRFNPDRQLFEQVAGVPVDAHFAYLWEDLQGNVLLAQSDLTGAYTEVTQMSCIRDDGTIFDFTYLTQISPRILCAYAADFFKTLFLGIDTGLSIIQNNRSKIRTYLAQNLTPYLRGAVMTGVAGDDQNNLYFAQENGGWYSLDLNRDAIAPLDLLDESTGLSVELRGTQQIHRDAAGYLWGISNSRSGTGRLHRVDLQSCQVRTYTYPYPFAAFCIGHDGLLWLTCRPENEKGLLVSFDPVTAAFAPFRDRNGDNPLRNSTPYYLIQGRDLRLLIGVDNDLFSIDLEKKSAESFSLNTGAASTGPFSTTIYVIYQDPSARLWLGANNGLHIFDPITRRLSTIDKRNGLASNTVYGILPDELGNYWISTNNGLSYYDPAKMQFRNFYAEDGFSHDEFNRFSFYRDPSGRYYFGGVNGMNAFSPRELLVNDPPPPVVLTKLTRLNSRSNGPVTDCAGLCNLAEVVISPYDSYFQFNFMLPSFYRSRKNQFRTKLEGYEKDWNYLGNTPNIRFSKLPAGRYTLLINGADPNGNWSRQTISIPIRVRPVFYRTWWFLLLGGLFLAGLINGWHKYRVEQQLRSERLRTKLSSDLHDEVSGLLSGIALQTDFLQETVDNTDSRNRLKAIGEKSRMAMSKMSDVIWSIDSRNDRVHDLLLRMYEHAEELLSPLDITYAFHTKRLDRQIKMAVKVRQELYFIFKEAINNISKHSNATRVDIFLGNQGNLFEMTIHDNGDNEVKVNGKTGQGLANIRMRAQRLDAQVDIINQEGYTVQLRMKKFT